MPPTAPDWAYVTDATTREWLQSLPIAEQQELHGRHPDYLQREHGNRIAAEVFALTPRSSDVPMPADFSDWDDDRKIDWWNAQAAARRAAESP